VDISQLISDATREDAAHRAAELNALTIAERMQQEFALADRLQRELALADGLQREVALAAEAARVIIESRAYDAAIPTLEPFHNATGVNSYEPAAGFTEVLRSSWNQYLGIDKTVMGIQAGLDKYVATVNESLTGVAAGVNHDLTGILGSITGIASSWNQQIATIERTMAQTCLGVNQFGQKLNETIAEALRPLAWPPEWLQSIIEQGANDLFSELELWLIEEGWYLSIDLPVSIVLEIADLHDEENFEGIEKTLQEFFRARIEMVEALIASEFPKRKRILEQAFRAHRAEDYALSVPVFLAQADGISAEVLQANFFRYSKVTRKINKLLKQGDIELSPTVLRHLSQLGSLRESFDFGKRPAGLNRHNILHGASTDYDTEANSLRSIALLEFLVSLRPVFAEANSEVLTIASSR
jgi:hypothetical protein